MNQDHIIPKRDEIADNDKWDLSLLFENDGQWEKALGEMEALSTEMEAFKGTLGTSAKQLKKALDLFIGKAELLEERLGYYAMLRREENVGDSTAAGLYSRLLNVSTRISGLTSFFKPEIQAIPDKTMKEFRATGLLDDYSIFLEKLLRFKSHTLGDAEERLIALQQEYSSTSNKAFSSLTNVDMDFGTVKTDKGEMPLTNTTFGVLLLDKDREVRKTAFNQFYSVFNGHKHTLSELYNGSVQKDIYLSRIRGYKSARAKALFPDKVPESVYDNLVEAVSSRLGALHDYYAMRKEMLGIEKMYLYDTKVSLVSDMESRYSYKEAVDVISKALMPLGEEYVATLNRGLLEERWVDRYENEGKRSGAFSAGSYTGNPYILMNYKENDIRHVFTLAHEGGHSMHSWYSVRNNPFPHYSYTIFEAEVASTFNEQLLAHYLLENSSSKVEKRYLLGRLLDDIIATIYRQTMFAEFEQTAHTMAEKGEPLTIDALRSGYRKLLQKYFGNCLELQKNDDLEGLRIPHFYRAFYVYKYATGLSAAITLSRRVLKGGEKEREEYLGFLKSGGSLYPLESLKAAGVDMSQQAPVLLALDEFSRLLAEFKSLS